MSKKFHFISGLPRSGSTLLGAVLRQNPNFMAGMSTAISPLTMSLLPFMGPTSEFGALFDDARRLAIMRGIFDSYYHDAKDANVIFDTNRYWTGRTPFLVNLFPECRIICCVREPGWIIDSFERLTRKFPLQISKVIGASGARATIYGREDILMDVKTGLVGMAWSSLKEAWHSEDAHRLIIMSYEGFVRNPSAAIKQLYAELNEPFFEHDFDHVEYSHDEFDEGIGLPGLHQVRPKISFAPRPPVIPNDIFDRYKDAMFWQEPLPHHIPREAGRPAGPGNGPTILC